MKRVTLVWLILCLLLMGALMQACGGKEGEKDHEEALMAVTIVYDNYEYDPRLKTAWGFSCLIEGLEETLLFDTGGDSTILLDNMRALGVDPSRVDVIVLSHIHGDHVGGLFGLLAENSAVKVILPESFPANFKDEVRAFGAELIEVHEQMEICSGVHSTGELGSGIKEQSLVIKTREGLVVITGCAHPGVVNIVRKAKALLDTQVYLVMGGFHMLGMGENRIEAVIAQFKEEGVQRVAPCHCSGDLTRELFQEVYGENFIEVGAGKIVELER
ncbi:MBL fold metallo-hydrolase [Candidatus Bipolaricaulota bacterium]|nr:MBL fold metallo-hydrolase [Candidatus Bipolaricaulota bacterium]